MLVVAVAELGMYRSPVQEVLADQVAVAMEMATEAVRQELQILVAVEVVVVVVLGLHLVLAVQAS
jgi:predicted ArsR family transcriptional regulator